MEAKEKQRVLDMKATERFGNALVKERETKKLENHKLYEAKQRLEHVRNVERERAMFVASLPIQDKEDYNLSYKVSGEYL